MRIIEYEVVFKYFFSNCFTYSFLYEKYYILFCNSFIPSVVLQTTICSVKMIFTLMFTHVHIKIKAYHIQYHYSMLLKNKFTISENIIYNIWCHWKTFNRKMYLTILRLMYFIIFCIFVQSTVLIFFQFWNKIQR